MSYNTETSVTVGATGTIVPFTFYGPRNVGPFDADGKADLTGYAITVTTKTAEGTVVVNAATCVMRNQTTHKSQGTWTLDADAAAKPKGEYKLRYKIEDSAGNKWYFPTNKDGSAGKLYMVDP